MNGQAVEVTCKEAGSRKRNAQRIAALTRLCCKAFDIVVNSVVTTCYA